MSKVAPGPRVCILILNWNGWRETLECLESLLRIAYDNYQVVVIDNNSSDDSIERIKAWAEGWQEIWSPESSHPLHHLSHPPVVKPIPYITYHRQEAEGGGNLAKEHELATEWKRRKSDDSRIGYPTTDLPLLLLSTGANLGFTGGNNVGLRYALATRPIYDYVLLLNNDMVVDRDFLKYLLLCGERFPRSGIIGPKIYFYNNYKMLQNIGNLLNRTSGELSIIGGSIIDGGQFDNYLKFSYISGACFFLKNKVLRTIGLLDEKYYMYSEDVDYCLRAQRNGFDCMYTPFAKVWHKWESSSNSKFVRYMTARNRIWLWKKNFCRGDYRRFVLYLLLCGLPRYFLYLIKERKLSLLAPYCRGILNGIRNRGEILYLKR
jgi:GT2 family glycosyltransferase